MPVSPPEGQMRAVWLQDPTAVPLPVNQFLISGGPAVGAEGTVPDSYIVTFGHLNPPVVPPFTSEAEALDFARNNVVTVVGLGRFSFTRARLEELRDVLTQVVESVPK